MCIHVPGRRVHVYLRGGSTDDTAATVLRNEYKKLGPMT